MTENYINGLIEEINHSLVRDINPQRGVLESAIHYALSVKCKRLRPLLFLILIEAYELKPLKYIDIACAIECIHTYSLIHDDLPSMDNDDFRRGMPTVHKKYDEAIALLAGDTLLTLAFEKISKCDIEPEKLISIFRILTSSIGLKGMAGGQALDLKFDGNKSRIYEIHQKKTAELIKSTLQSAAVIIGLDESEMTTIEKIGDTIGLAFQLTDDLLDVEGNELIVGKKLNKDQKNQSPNSALFFGPDVVKGEIDRLYLNSLELLKKLEIDFPPFLFLMKKMVYRSK